MMRKYIKKIIQVYVLGIEPRTLQYRLSDLTNVQYIHQMLLEYDYDEYDYDEYIHLIVTLNVQSQKINFQCILRDSSPCGFMLSLSPLTTMLTMI